MLCRMTNGMTSYKVVANYLTNTPNFEIQNYQNTDFTNVTSTNMLSQSYKYVVHVNMAFCRYQYPLTIVGPGYYYDYYKMELWVAPHNLP
jgi:hypothetical protein